MTAIDFATLVAMGIGLALVVGGVAGALGCCADRIGNLATCCCPCGCDFPTARYRGLCVGCAEDGHYEDDAA